MINIGFKTFLFSLGLSFIVHVLLIGILSNIDSKVLRKPLKQIEVTYNFIKPKNIAVKKNRYRDLKVIEDPEPVKNIDIHDKRRDVKGFIGESVKDMSKMTDKIELSKIFGGPRIKTLDMGQKVTISMVKSEKITNPSYVGYQREIRSKILNNAQNLELPADFEVGDVYITFVVSSNGSVTDIKANPEKSLASAELMEHGLKLIRKSHPFFAFPRDLNYPELTFNVMIHFR